MGNCVSESNSRRVEKGRGTISEMSSGKEKCTEKKSSQETPSCKLRKRSIQFMSSKSDDTESTSAKSDYSTGGQLSRGSRQAVKFVEDYDSESDSEDFFLEIRPLDCSTTRYTPILSPNHRNITTRKNGRKNRTLVDAPSPQIDSPISSIDSPCSVSSTSFTSSITESPPIDPAVANFRGRLELMRRFYSWKEIPMDFFVDSHVTVESVNPARKSKKKVEKAYSERTPGASSPLHPQPQFSCDKHNLAQPA